MIKHQKNKRHIIVRAIKVPKPKPFQPEKETKMETKIKYSFLMPYIASRFACLQKTLESFTQLYKNRSDYEVCIMMTEYRNPAVAFNRAARLAKGDFFILTNPECKHTVDVLSGFDKELEIDENAYIVGACQRVTFEEEKFIRWYQHSKHNNRLLHFCSCISKKNWLKINGFCEQYSYSNGLCYEDNDILKRILKEKIKIVVRDDLLVNHLEHDRQYMDGNLAAQAINKQLYKTIWNENVE